MKRSLFFIGFFFLISGYFCFGQYSISGYLDTPTRNKRVYLSLLKYNEQSTIATEQILMSTLTDSLGYFSFEGQLLSDKHALYRIHSRVDENEGALQMANHEELKNLHNFVFSNQDTIVFEKNNKYWFSSNTNTNPVDKQWQEYHSYANQLKRELLSVSEFNQNKQSTTQLLSELKAYAINKEVHPLVTLILLSDVETSIIKEDLKNNPGFYKELQERLNGYYNNTGYAQQFKELLNSLTREERDQKLDYYQRMTYLLGAVSFILGIGVIFLLIKLKRRKKADLPEESINLTSQEERIAELIALDKTNKEIATELFISLNTVKTHIRNIYAKLEVGNRQEFIDKMKNQSGD
ncbi:response regulator transcription factor [Robertkochia flava]|uniref:response regulator transcription factor n=1 Tax=Robertkochia flava TaxID=3447986 RepID=UPI00293D735B|nr:LuxR C-terminal-related transcriptional regulator [Robertkochia marina]